MIRIIESKDVGRLLARKAARFTEAEAVVRPILDDVRKRGDRALLEYARKFDKLERKSVAVPVGELEAAAKALSPAFRSAKKFPIILPTVNTMTPVRSSSSLPPTLHSSPRNSSASHAESLSGSAAIIRISVGPATKSIPTSPASSFFAAAT